MSADVALAGIVFCADDWAAFEPSHRAELIAAAMGEDSFYELAERAGEWDAGTGNSAVGLIAASDP